MSARYEVQFDNVFCAVLTADASNPAEAFVACQTEMLTRLSSPGLKATVIDRETGRRYRVDLDVKEVR